MKSVTELRKEHAKELAKAKRQEQILTKLPVAPNHVCIHDDHISLKYQKPGYGGHFSFPEAVAIYQQYRAQVVESEHWKDGCVSCRPKAINTTAKKKGAVMDGAHHAEIVMHSYGSRGEYQDSELRFWVLVKIGAKKTQLCEVGIQFTSNWQWLPERQVSYSTHGDVSSFSLSPRAIGEDARRKFWSEPPSYRFSYYWADALTFSNFTGKALEK